MTTPVTLSTPTGELELPVVPATTGEDGYDISKLLSTTGAVTLDVGFVNTASCQSSITFIDGEQGILRYRGYPIEQLADSATFLEVASLLINGELPQRDELSAFEKKVSENTAVTDDLKGLFQAFPATAHPMMGLGAAVLGLAAHHTDTLDPHDDEQIEAATYRLLGGMSTLAAHSYRHLTGKKMIDPADDLGYVANFLRMCFADDNGDYEVDPAVVRAFETLFILHADHEQNCSTSTVRMVGSADSSIYASVCAGVQALAGPLHGGANQAVLEMLGKLRDEGTDVKSFVNQVKDKKSGVKLMGFGHRVYKNYDPRATIIKGHADALLRASGEQNQLLDMALELEEAALNDEYFISRKLYPNVDFYTGLIYEAMGFPAEYFTVLFTLGRLPGWIAQWREQEADPARKIGRPRQIYTGEVQRDYLAISDR